MFQRTTTNCYHLFRCVKAMQAGGPEVLKVVDFPITSIKLREDEALVRMSYAGVNFIDTYYRSGLYTKPTHHHLAAPYPYIVGEEGSGAVVQCGSPEAKAQWLNKRVAFVTAMTGSYSSFAVVRVKDLFEIPNTIDDKLAATAMLQGLVAHYLTHDTFPVKEGSVVLVHAAAGGTGLLITQMAKARGASLVIGVCGGAEKAEAARTIGKCDAVVDYKATPEWEKEVIRITGGDKCHVVYDGVGRSTFLKSLSSLRPRGMMVCVGNASGAVEPIAPLMLNTLGSLFLTRPKLADYILDRCEAERRVGELFTMVEDKRLAVTLHSVHKMEKAAKAHELLESKATIGKVLVNCQE